MEALGEVGCPTAPLPHAACEEGFDTASALQLAFVLLTGVVVVVPINKGQIVREHCFLLRGDWIAVTVIIHQGSMVTEEHVIPDHGLQTILLTQVTGDLQVLHDDLPVTPVALIAQVTTGTQADCFVHAQMDPAAAEGFAEMCNHGLHQGNGVFLANHQIINGIAHGLHVLPANCGTQMGQSLNTGNKLNTQSIRKVIQFLLLCHRVPASAVTEVRITGKFVGILHVQVSRVETHQSQMAEEAFHGLHGVHTVAGQIDHGSQTGKPGLQAASRFIGGSQRPANEIQGIADGIRPYRYLAVFHRPPNALTVTGKPLDHDLGQRAVKRCAGTQQIQSVLQSGIGCKKLHKINPSRHRQ